MKKYREADRVIDRQMETAYRYRHHCFGGLSVSETATVMGISEQEVIDLLVEMEKLAPQLFPILTPGQGKTWFLWHDSGFTCKEVAVLMNTTEDVVKKRLQAIKKKTGYKRGKRRGKPFSLDVEGEGEINENDIKRRF